MSDRAARLHGFTLLEVIIAVTITGIILLTVYGTLSRTIMSKEYAEQKAQLGSVGREAVLRMGDEIESSLSPAYSPNVVFRGVHGGGDQFADQIDFAIASPPPSGPMGELAGTGGRVQVVYSLDETEDRGPAYLLRRDQFPVSAAGNDGESEISRALDGDDTEGGTNEPIAMMVADNVAGLRFRYLDGESRQWVEEWDSTEEAFAGRLPLAVEIAVYLYDDVGNIHDFVTIVDLPLANFGQATPTPGGNEE